MRRLAVSLFLVASLTVAVLVTTVACGGRNRTKADAAGAGLRSTTEAADQSAATAAYAEMSYPVEIDVRKDYPKRTISLQDVAEVTYTPFETSNEVLMDAHAWLNFSISDSMVVTGSGSGTIFVMGRNGRLISKFNRQGRGPGEYDRIQTHAADLHRGEIFVYAHPGNQKIFVYSLGGEYRRTITVPTPMWLYRMMDYNEEDLLVWAHLPPSQTADDDRAYRKPFKPYYLVSKQTGEFRALPIEVTEFNDGSIHKITDIDKYNSNYASRSYGASSLVRNGREIFISDFACDTIYSLKGGKLSPFMVPKGKAKNVDVSLRLKTSRYSVFSVVERDEAAFDFKDHRFIGIDHRTGDIFEAEFRNADTVDGRFGGSVNNYSTSPPAECCAMLLPALALTDARDAGKLKGRLAEVAANLKEDDNPVIMLIGFKK